MQHFKLLNAILEKWVFSQSPSHADTIMTDVYKRARLKFCRIFFFNLVCIMFYLLTVWLGNFSKVFLMCFFLLFPITCDWMTALTKICISFFFCSHSNLTYYLSQLHQGNFFHFAIKSEDESVCSDNILLLTWVAYVILYVLFFVLLIACKSFRNVDFFYVLFFQQLCK